METTNGEMAELWEERLLRHKAERLATYEDHLHEQEHLTDGAETAASRRRVFRVEWRSRSHAVVIAFADRPNAAEADLAAQAVLLRPLRATGELVLVEQKTGRIVARRPFRPATGRTTLIAA